MRTMRRRLLDTLGVRARTVLDDIPCLFTTDAHGLAGETLPVLVAALPRVLSVGVMGKNGSSQKDDENHEHGENGEVHRDLGDGGGVVVGL
jgi:hypothetical protein